jgi:hypothetical protein
VDVKSGGGWAWDSRGWLNVTGNAADLVGLSISGDVNITGTGTLIKDTLIKGEVKQGYPTSGAVSIVDSEVDNGTAQVGAVVATNLTVTGSNLHGGQQAIHCDENCAIKDSYLHGQYNPTTVTAHLGGFLSSGGGHITLTHNTIQCDAAPHGNGGCSGDLNLYGDFGPITDVTVTNNLFPGINNYPSYCVYGGSSTGKAYNTATKVTFTGNQFGAGPNGKCGQFGPVAGWTVNSNTWSNNTWADGPNSGNAITP